METSKQERNLTIMVGEKQNIFNVQNRKQTKISLGNSNKTPNTSHKKRKREIYKHCLDVRLIKNRIKLNTTNMW